MIDKVNYLIERGITDVHQISEILEISPRSASAYKAHINRRNGKCHSKSRETPPLGELEKRTGSYILIPSDKLCNLNGEERKYLSYLLNKIYESEENAPSIVDTPKNSKEGKISSSDDGLLNPLPSSEIREIVIENKNAGIDNCHVYEDSRLKGVKQSTIAAYLAHWTMGTYDKERRVQDDK